jgi:pyruvate dehydrogenase E2 component (dihydrolipoamide acetyltransferase)
MAIDVTMPKLSDTMEEGKILRWMKQVGEPVKIGDILAEVETDKANMELEAYDEGTLAEVKVEEGQSAPVGSVIAVLSAPGEAAAKLAKKAAAAPKSAPARQADAEPEEEGAEAQEAAAETGSSEAPKQGAAKAPARAEAAKPAPAAKPASQEKQAPAAREDAGREPWRPTVVRRPAAAEERVKASPLARRIASDHELDLAGIRGTGPGGRIVEKDVDAALAARGATPAHGERQPAPKRPAEAAARPAEAPAPRPGGRIELSRIRRTTAKRMGESKREVPHFYASTDIHMDEAVHLKESLVALGAEYEKLTFTHLVLKATGLALRRVPELNASYDGDAMVLHEAANIGMATAINDGLVVLVVRDCDRASLAEIAQQTAGLLERARAGRFAADDMSGGTFTVSNLGMLPVTEFAAIINPPQAAILAVGAIRDVPVVKAGQVVPGKLMTVTLSSDHRIIDGVLAGRFLRELKALLENPLALVV